MTNEANDEDVEDDGVRIDVERALARLKSKNGLVHVASFESGMLIGHEWTLSEVERIFRLVGAVAELLPGKRGPISGHDLFLLKDGRIMYFFETKERTP